MPSRNAPCPCGSGRRYKQCCGIRGHRGADSDPARAERHRALERYRATLTEDPMQRLAETRRSPPPEPEPPLGPEEVEALRAFYERHYRDWLDHPLPAQRA